MTKQILESSEYEIKKAKIIRTKKMTSKEKLFEITLLNGEELGHDPGQFVEVSIFGVGEAPLSLSSSPTKEGSFEICVREVGKLTAVLNKLEAGAHIGIRGPFGKGFPLRRLEGNDLILIAGGIGIVPLRSLINYVIDNRRDFGKVSVLLGCKTPQNMLFGDEIKMWDERLDINFLCTIDKSDPDWKGNVGLITLLIPKVDADPSRTFAVIVGPPVMYKFVIAELIAKGIPDSQIIVSLERHMKCGLGKCGHCQIDNVYCCQDGPVFSYEKIKHLEEAF